MSYISRGGTFEYNRATTYSSAGAAAFTNLRAKMPRIRAGPAGTNAANQCPAGDYEKKKQPSRTSSGLTLTRVLDPVLCGWPSFGGELVRGFAEFKLKKLALPAPAPQFALSRCRRPDLVS